MEQVMQDAAAAAAAEQVDAGAVVVKLIQQVDASDVVQKCRTSTPPPLCPEQDIDAVAIVDEVDAAAVVQEVDTAALWSTLPECVRCGRVHDDKGDKGLEEYRCARRRLCSRCGLLHRDYMLSARMYGVEEFDCEVFLPDLKDVKMDGNTILLPAHVIKMIDDLVESKKQKATMVDSMPEDSDEVNFVMDSFTGETEVPDSLN
uniref:Uncharacterized protein n=1 Tax=Oryza meridionalis TaxID=40149 RepID=A0A0E0CJP3_9ORYZ